MILIIETGQFEGAGCLKRTSSIVQRPNSKKRTLNLLTVVQDTEVRDPSVRVEAHHQTDPAGHQQRGGRVIGVGQGAQH